MAIDRGSYTVGDLEEIDSRLLNLEQLITDSSYSERSRKTWTETHQDLLQIREELIAESGDPKEM